MEICPVYPVPSPFTGLLCFVHHDLRTNSSAGPPLPLSKKALHCNLSLNEFRIFYQNHLKVSFTALKLFDNFFNFDRAQAQCLHSFYKHIGKFFDRPGNMTQEMLR